MPCRWALLPRLSLSPGLCRPLDRRLDPPDRPAPDRLDRPWLPFLWLPLALLLELPAMSPAQALPMSWPGSTTVGGEIDPHWSSLWFSHALDRRNGLGLSLQELPDRPMPTDRSHSHSHSAAASSGTDSQGAERFLLLDWTHRLQRWNMPEAQANVWLFAGVGAYHGSAGSGDSSQRTSHGHPAADAPPLPASLRLAASPGLQLDIETSRLRLEGRGRLLVAEGVQRALLSTTAGVALTPARYDGTQPWLELQLRAMPGVIDGVELVPRLRLLHRHLVLDVGYSTLGSVVGGFTFSL